MSDFGLYPRDREIYGFTDNELFDGIRDFQFANNLTVDGIIRPVGETIDAINDLLGGVFGDGSRDRDDRPPTRRFSVRAEPFTWSKWIEIFSQFGVIKSRNHVTRITVSLSRGAGNSSFDYEIKGGDHFIRGTAGSGGTSETVAIKGNVATSVSVRVKSHLGPQVVIITVQ